MMRLLGSIVRLREEFYLLQGVEFCLKTKLWNDMEERDCRTLEEFYARVKSTYVLRMPRRPWES